jgi:hypothetical protein
LSQLSADVSNAIDSLMAISGLIPARPLIIEDKVFRIIPKPLADAILDRLVHNAYKINLRGESMRKKKAKLTSPTESE